MLDRKFDVGSKWAWSAVLALAAPTIAFTINVCFHNSRSYDRWGTTLFLVAFSAGFAYRSCWNIYSLAKDEMADFRYSRYSVHDNRTAGVPGTIFVDGVFFLGPTLILALADLASAR